MRTRPDEADSRSAHHRSRRTAPARNWLLDLVGVETVRRAQRIRDRRIDSAGASKTNRAFEAGMHQSVTASASISRGRDRSRARVLRDLSREMPTSCISRSSRKGIPARLPREVSRGDKTGDISTIAARRPGSCMTPNRKPYHHRRVRRSGSEARVAPDDSAISDDVIRR